MIIILAILVVIFMMSTIYFGFKCYEFGKTIINVQDEIENCLEILDERYASMSQILEKPVFFDSLEVRQVIKDIQDSRDSILVVASSLSKSIENVSDNDKQDTKEEGL